MQHHCRGCNNIPSFLQRTTPISWTLCEDWTRHDLHILVTAPFCYDRKSRAACAQSFAPRQQATIEIMLAITLTIACSHYIYNFIILHTHWSVCSPVAFAHLQCEIHPRTSGRMDCDVIDANPRQTYRPKRALTSVCMELTYKCRLLGLFPLALADFAHM